MSALTRPVVGAPLTDPAVGYPTRSVAQRDAPGYRPDCPRGWRADARLRGSEWVLTWQLVEGSAPVGLFSTPARSTPVALSGPAAPAPPRGRAMLWATLPTELPAGAGAPPGPAVLRFMRKMTGTPHQRAVARRALLAVSAAPGATRTAVSVAIDAPLHSIPTLICRLQYEGLIRIEGSGSKVEPYRHYLTEKGEKRAAELAE